MATETEPPAKDWASELVVDTSVILAVVLNESHRERLVELTEGIELIAPASLPAEFGNALSSLLKRKRIDAVQARQAVEDFRRISIRFVEIDLEAAVDAAASLNIYAYDAYMLTTARRRNSALVTLDGGLAECCRRARVNVIEVT